MKITRYRRSYTVPRFGYSLRKLVLKPSSGGPKGLALLPLINGFHFDTPRGGTVWVEFWCAHRTGPFWKAAS